MRPSIRPVKRCETTFRGHAHDRKTTIAAAGRVACKPPSPTSSRARPSSSPRRPALHNEAALDLLVDAAGPRASDVSLDVACGPGSVVVAFARRLRRAEGLDATEAMLAEARKLAAAKRVENVAWHRGDIYALPFADAAFDIVSCRFAFHHLQEPARAFAEMIRVCRVGGRIVLCDAVASDDPAKAAAFNAMERHRDPSTVEFRPLGFLHGPVPRCRPAGAHGALLRRAGRARPAGGDVVSGGRRPRAAAGHDRPRRSTATAWASTPGATGTPCGSSIRRWCWWR